MKNLFTLVLVIFISIIIYSFISKNLDSQRMGNVTVSVKGSLIDKVGNKVTDKYKVYVFQGYSPMPGERSVKHTNIKKKIPGEFEFDVVGHSGNTLPALTDRELGYESDVVVQFDLVFEKYVDNPKQPTGRDTVYYWPACHVDTSISVIVEPKSFVKEPLEVICRLTEPLK